MTGQQSPTCNLCHLRQVKVFCVQYGEALLDVCGRCHRQMTKHKHRTKRRYLPGQTLFPFMVDK